jgi:hypothetical protein
MLGKAALRKRRGDQFDLPIPRDLAQWFAAFWRPSGWWVFGDVYVPAQWSPDPVQGIAGIFLRAASRHRGRTSPSLHKLEERLNRLTANPDTDERWLRRLQARIRGLQFAKAETLTAGHD